MIFSNSLCCHLIVCHHCVHWISEVPITELLFVCQHFICCVESRVQDMSSQLLWMDQRFYSVNSLLIKEKKPQEGNNQARWLAKTNQHSLHKANKVDVFGDMVWCYAHSDQQGCYPDASVLVKIFFSFLILNWDVRCVVYLSMKKLPMWVRPTLFTRFSWLHTISWAGQDSNRKTGKALISLLNLRMFLHT